MHRFADTFDDVYAAAVHSVHYPTSLLGLPQQQHHLHIVDYFNPFDLALSIVFAISTKFLHMFDRRGDVGLTIAVGLYFLSDSVSRGLSLAMFYGAVDDELYQIVMNAE